MKTARVSAFVLAAVAVLLCSSCTKKPSGTKPEMEAAISQSGIVAWQGAPFYVDSPGSTEKRVEWKSALDFGTKVRETDRGTPRVYAVGGQNLTLIAVEIATPDGSSAGWMQPAHVAGGAAEPAVVTDAETLLRKAASPDSGPLARLHRMDLVAVIRTTASGDMIRAVAFDPVQKAQYPEAYVDGKALSFSRDDVAAAVLVAKAAAARDADDARSILENAAQSFPSSSFIGEINTLLRGNGHAQPSGPATEPIAATLTVHTDGAVVRGTPSADAASVKTLKLDDEVTTVSRTVDSFDAGGQRAHWYEVTSPAHGWVFGLDLEGAD